MNWNLFIIKYLKSISFKSFWAIKLNKSKPTLESGFSPTKLDSTVFESDRRRAEFPCILACPFFIRKKQCFQLGKKIVLDGKKFLRNISFLYLVDFSYQWVYLRLTLRFPLVYCDFEWRRLFQLWFESFNNSKRLVYIEIKWHREMLINRSVNSPYL